MVGEGDLTHLKRSSKMVLSLLLQPPNAEDEEPTPSKVRRLSNEGSLPLAPENSSDSSYDGACENGYAATLNHWSLIALQEYSVGRALAEFKELSSNFGGYSDVLPRIFIDFVRYEEHVNPSDAESMLQRALILTKRLFRKLRINRYPSLNMSASTWHWPVTELPCASAIIGSESFPKKFSKFNNYLRKCVEYLHGLDRQHPLGERSLSHFLPRLSSLTIPGFQLTPSHLEILSIFCPQLRSVNFRDGFEVYDTEEDLVTFFQRCTQLEEVNLLGKANKLDAASIFPALPRSLQKLAIQMRLKAVTDFDNLVTLTTTLRRLEVLDIVYWMPKIQPTDNHISLDFLANIPQLQRLGIYVQQSYGPVGYRRRKLTLPETIAASLQLRHLNITGFEIWPLMVQRIVSNFEKLEVLKIADCEYVGFAAYDLCHLQHLTSLAISHPHGLCIRTLSAITAKGRLKYLSLNGLHECNGEHLASFISATLRNCSKLACLSLHDLPALTSSPFEVLPEVLEQRRKTQEEPKELVLFIKYCHLLDSRLIPSHPLLKYNCSEEKDFGNSDEETISMEDLALATYTLPPLENQGHRLQYSNTKLHLNRTKSYIDEVPNEILDKILSYLPLVDLFKMELVCKQWRELALKACRHVHDVSFTTLFGATDSAFRRPVIFRRGLLRQVLSRCALRRLELDALRGKLVGSDLKAVAGILPSTLKALDVSDICITKETFFLNRHFASSKKGEAVELMEAICHNCFQDDVSHQLNTCLECFRKLVVLDIGGGEHAWESPRLFKALPTSMISLNVGRMKFSKVALNRLQTRCRKLQRLMLSMDNLVSRIAMPALKKLLEALKELQSLRLNVIFKPNDDLQLVDVNFELLPKLAFLTFTGAHLTAETLKSLCSGCGNLKCLDLSGVDSVASNDGLMELAKLPNLMFLDLSDTSVDDSIVQRIAKRGILRAFLLRWNSGVTDLGITSILRHCQHLICLDIFSCKNVTDHSLTEMRNFVRTRKELSNQSDTSQGIEELKDCLFVVIPRSRRIFRALIAADENKKLTPFEDICDRLGNGKMLELHAWIGKSGIKQQLQADNENLLKLYDGDADAIKSPFLKLSHDNFRLKKPTFY